MLILIASASIDRLHFKDFMEEGQVLFHTTQIELKVHLKVTGYKNEMENDGTLNIRQHLFLFPFIHLFFINLYWFLWLQ